MTTAAHAPIQKTGPALAAGHDYTDVISQACRDGCALLDKLIGRDDDYADGEEALRGRFLQFLPMARALVFLKSIKLGAGVGLQHGQGFIVARLPNGDSVSRHWSAPCFVRVEGLEAGLVWGVEQVETLVGVLSERAFEDLLHKRRVTLGAEWNVALWPFVGENWELPFHSDLAMARVGRGVMLGGGVAADVIYMDDALNTACYGRFASPEAVLAGALPPPPAMRQLCDKLRDATCAALAACFEDPWCSTSPKSFESAKEG